MDGSDFVEFQTGCATGNYLILSSIKQPEDIKKLSVEQLRRLCSEVRSFLLIKLSGLGGHVASNLGVVELTTAIHYCFDIGFDRLVFDVGHQCYTHKLYTGRLRNFDTLRKANGISGFPKPSESPYDAFVTGHGSTAISVALGLARAESRKPKSEDRRRCIAVVGDGAMTGGLAYEGLNDAGCSNLPLIVILNDNGMSISKSVGALARVLTRFRVKLRYRRAKERYHKVMDRIPGGAKLNKLFTSVKNGVKHMMIPDTFFEIMGFEYVGPVDGHDIAELIKILTQAKTYTKPVLIHVVTQKGKGYCYSEGSPEKFHGVEGFNLESGERVGGGISFAGIFGEKLCEMAEKHGDIAAITAAMQYGAGLSEFAKRFPERYYDVGIAEEHGVTMAAGMAAGGMRPFVAIYSTFLQRAFDQIMHDVGIMSLPVVFCVDRAGLIGEDGETHQGIYDQAMLAAVPGMRVYMPSNGAELSSMLEAAYRDRSTPCAIRYPRGGESGFREDTSAHGAVKLRDGGDITLIVTGRLVDNVLAAAETLEKRGYSAAVVKLNRIIPVPTDELYPLLGKKVLVCEETVNEGSVGMRLAAELSGKGIEVRAKNCGNRFIPQGTVEEQLRYCGLDPAGIASCAEAFCIGE